MTTISTFSSARAGARRRRARRGVAALEAVFVLPLMVFIIVGGIELYLYARGIAIMDRVAFTLANSISLQTSLIDDASCSSPNRLCTYGAIMPTLLTPLAAENASAIISVYATNEPSGGSGPSAWTSISSPNHGWTETVYQGADAGTPASRVSAASLPPAIISNNLRTADTVIVAELFYTYTPFAVSSSLFNVFLNTRQYSRALIRPRYADLCTLSDPSNPAPVNSVCGS